MVINHKDANGMNNFYKNLEWISQRENVVKSYETSGINQLRNYKFYNIIYPNGKVSELLKGNSELKSYIINNRLKCSFKSLIRHNISKGYKLIKRSKYEIL